MPGIYEADRAVPMPDIGEELFNVESYDTPFVSGIKKGDALKNMLTDWEVESYDDTELEGVVDGADVTDFGGQNREAMEAYAMQQRETWMVTKQRELTSTAGVKNEKNHQSLVALTKLKLKMERTALSDMEMRRGNKVEAYRMRSVWNWLSATAQAVKPVPEAFRPSADCWYTGTLANFTSDVFEEMLGAAADQIGRAVDLDGQVGRQLKSKMSKWGQLVSVGDGEASTVRRNEDASSRKMERIINVFEFESGIVRNHLNFNLLCAIATGKPTAYTPKSGVWLSNKMWRRRYLQAPKRFDLTDAGGGPRGYADVLWMLFNGNPLGQLAMKSNS